MLHNGEREGQVLAGRKASPALHQKVCKPLSQALLASRRAAHTDVSATPGPCCWIWPLRDRSSQQLEDSQEDSLLMPLRHRGLFLQGGRAKGEEEQSPHCTVRQREEEKKTQIKKAKEKERDVRASFKRSGSLEVSRRAAAL